jgi:hypothetical protein
MNMQQRGESKYIFLKFWKTNLEAVFAREVSLGRCKGGLIFGTGL